MLWKIGQWLSKLSTEPQKNNNPETKLFNETKIGQMLRNKMGNRWCEKQFSIDLKFDQQKFDIHKFSNTTIYN